MKWYAHIRLIGLGQSSHSMYSSLVGMQYEVLKRGRSPILVYICMNLFVLCIYIRYCGHRNKCVSIYRQVLE